MGDTKVVLSGLTLATPVIPASGTFGFGYEFNECAAGGDDGIVEGQPR